MNKGFETYFEDVDYLFHLNDAYTNMINDLSNKDNLSNEEIENQLLASNEFTLKVIIASCIEHYSNEILYPRWINTPEFKGFKYKVYGYGDFFRTALTKKEYKITEENQEYIYQHFSKSIIQTRIRKIKSNRFDNFQTLSNKIYCLIECIESKTQDNNLYKLQIELMEHIDDAEKLLQTYNNFKQYVLNNIDDIQIIYYHILNRLQTHDIYIKKDESFKLRNEINVHLPMNLVDSSGHLCYFLPEMNNTKLDIMNFILFKYKIHYNEYNHVQIMQNYGYYVQVIEVQEQVYENINDLYTNASYNDYSRRRYR